MNQERLLLVDDDRQLSAMLSDYLAHEGYQVTTAADADEATALLSQPGQFDLLVLDIMMPGRSGLELLQSLRPALQLPVIMLTGRGDEIDRILGLEMGADDYLAKPCNPRELLARIRAVLRRAQYAEQASQPQVLEMQGIRLDPGRREVRVNDALVELTSVEFNVLAELMRKAGEVLSKEQLTERVLHRKLTAYDRALDVHVSRLRQKLAQQHESAPELIKTVRGQGYQFIRGES
ncbi:response regulator transcription factor [Nitrincola alkalilacustris]|uniref:response regulator transcription factor n=1 Tax=Nitrincola alkalilacustris TaxID=1571224 RepID=UPI00124F13E3|nr:response regulator transcription factor [Nitrincola alkalilacustris]